MIFWETLLGGVCFLWVIFGLTYYFAPGPKQPFTLQEEP
jgi:hypothetical protein